jgi:hypothetical protein
MSDGLGRARGEDALMSAFLFVLGVFAATATTDVLSSHYLLADPAFQEVGFSPFSNRTANTAVKLGLGGVTSYALSRVYEKRPRVAWVLTVVLLAVEAIAVFRNVRFLEQRK